MDARTTKALISMATVFVTGGAVGAFVGFVEGKRKGRKDAWTEAEIELDQQEDRLKRLYKVGQYSEPWMTGPVVFPTPESGTPEIPLGVTLSDPVAIDPEALAQLKEHIERQGYATLDEARADLEPEQTLFDRFQNDDVAEVTPNMEDPEPYPISEDEFNHDMENYTKISLVWYGGDRVLSDELERAVDDAETTVGLNNMNLIGPENPVLYIRNNRLQADFEVRLELGSYRETVLGEEAPVMERRGRKSRPKDE